ncbi:MAG: hypothetical protein ACK55O_07460 [Phycisphaerales bacterium]|jgi:hypothetical protein|nr:hypothetical protein [Phycisphaeraceae bacterium]
MSLVSTISARRARVLPFVLLSAAAAVAGGCGAQRQEDICAGDLPRPLGSHVAEWTGRQTAKARGSEFTLYRFRFQPGSTELTNEGRRIMARLTSQLNSEAYPIVIEPEDNNPQLDEGRRRAIVSMITQARILDPETRVVIAAPTAEGLRGEEANLINDALRGGGVGGGGGGRSGSGGR